ncbi:MAG TPA: glycosyltransferase family 39 protein [Candidatus Obscuribacterales bacterium]
MRLVLILQIAVTAAVFAQAYIYRNSFFQEDAIAYLDMARSLMKGDWLNIVDAIWSPLYPVLISVWLSLFNPSPEIEPQVVMACNFSIFLGQLIAFEWFRRQFMRFRLWALPEDGSFAPLDDRYATIILYFAFAFSVTVLSGVFQQTPDWIANSFLYASLAVFLKIVEKPDRSLNFVLLGVFIGLGYLAKSVYVAYTFLFFLFCLLALRQEKSRWKHLSTYLLTVALLSAPHVIALSFKLGKPSMMETGKLSIQETVMGKPGHHRIEPGLKHGERILFADPLTYAFPDFPDSTYAVWRHRAYYAQGTRLEIDLGRWLRVTGMNVLIYFFYFGIVLLIALAAASLLARRKLFTSSALKAFWPLHGFSILALAMIAPMTNLTFDGNVRYFAPLVVVATAALIGSLRLLKDDKRSKLASFTLVTFLPAYFSLFIFSMIKTQTFLLSRPDPPVSVRIARGLHELGLKNGDCVAQLGFLPGTMRIYEDLLPLSASSNYFWAYLGRLRIVADIPHEKRFFEVSEETRRELISRLKSVGARALVIYPGHRPPASHRQEWTRVPGSECYVLLFPQLPLDGKKQSIEGENNDR